MTSAGRGTGVTIMSKQCVGNSQDLEAMVVPLAGEGSAAMAELWAECAALG